MGITVYDSEVKSGVVELSVCMHVFRTAPTEGMMLRIARMNIVFSRITEVQV